MATHAAPPSQALTVLVVGANGYLGSAVCRAFLRSGGPPPFFFRVFGLVRRECTALDLAADEIVPIVGSISDPVVLSRKVLSHSATWDVIVICTEPSKLDPTSEDQHWRDILSLVESLAESSASASQQRPVRPMVLWSSGCKDYGTTALHGDLDLQPHTEESPLIPHPLVRGRMYGAMRALATSQNGGGPASFDVAVVRATPVFGYSGSYHGATFDYMDAYVASMSDKDDKVLKIPSHEGTIMHGIHVDDCGDAYVALAKTAILGGRSPWTTSHSNGCATDRSAIAGQQFNISSRRYEALREVGAALATEYGLTQGAMFSVPPRDLPGALSSQDTALVFGYSQWVSSEKIRTVTGWSDSRPLFHENIGAFRRAYNAAKAKGSENIVKTRQRIGGYWGDL